MRVTLWLRTPLGLMVLAAALALSSLANATPTSRTFVASTGNDANTASNCPLATPCRTFVGAYSVTTAGGEIIALDSAGYGPVTITSAVSIIGAQVASITVPTNGIGVSINASGTVILRNLEINGGSNTNTTGILMNGGRLSLENSTLKLLTAGMQVDNAKADVRNTEFIADGVGISTTGTGTDNAQGFVTGAYGPTQVRLYGGAVIGNGDAFFMQDPGVAGSNSNYSNITILLYNGGSVDTELVGNAQVMTGAGSGCPSGASNTSGQQCWTTMQFSSTVNDSGLQP